MLMRAVPVKLDDIYVPARWRGTRDAAKVETLAESILEKGQTTPIQVRKDGARYVLVSGFHRMEAMKALGEATIQALVVAAPKT
jgi:ParB-like chromosome segregation protein Spo0J